MKILFFSAKPYDQVFFDRANQPYGFEIEYRETHLGPHSVNLINSEEAVCVFVNDKLNAEVLEALHQKGVKIIALRCAGFNNVDLAAAKKLGIEQTRLAHQVRTDHSQAISHTQQR